MSDTTDDMESGATLYEAYLERKQNNMDNNKPDPVFADGFIFKRPREGAPDFVKGALSIKVGEAIAFLQKHNNAGWVNLDLKNSQGGKLYLQLNDWKPTPKDNEQPPANGNTHLVASMDAQVYPVAQQVPAGEQPPAQAPTQAGTNPQDSQDAPPLDDSHIPF